MAVVVIRVEDGCMTASNNTTPQRAEFHVHGVRRDPPDARKIARVLN